MTTLSKNHHGKNLSNSKIIRLLKTFSTEELQELDDFLKTLYSTQYIILQVFDYLKPLYPDFEQQTELVKIYQSVYQELPADNNQFINLQNSISDLYQCILQYLSWQESKTKSFESEMVILKILKKRKLNADFHSRIKSRSNKLRKKKEKDFWYYLQQLQLQHWFYYSSEIEKLDKNSNWIAEAMDMLDQFYIMAKMRYSCELYSRANLLQEKNNIFFLPHILEEFKKRDWPAGHLSVFYYHALQLIRDKKEEDYRKLLEQFKTQQVFSIREQFIFWTYLSNFISSNIREGDSDYFREAHSLYKMGLKKELFLVDGYFDENIFLNIVNVGCTLEAFQEVKVFIKKWSKYLPFKIKESISNLAQARLSFALDKHEDTIAHCMLVQFKNDTHALQTKMLELRSYYEIYGLSGKKVYRKVKQLEVFIAKNKNLHTDYLEGCITFLEFFQELTSPPVADDFLKKLEEAQPIMAKDWLASKFRSKR